MAQQSEGIKILAAEVMLVCNRFGTGKLAKGHAGVFGVQPRRLGRTGLEVSRKDASGPHRHPRHGFNARSNHQVLSARHDGLRCELNGLLGRAALTVNRHRRYAFGQGRGQHGIATDMQTLFAALADAAHDDILNGSGIDAGIQYCGVQYARGQIDGVPPGHLTATTATRGAQCRTDICFGHFITFLHVGRRTPA